MRTRLFSLLAIVTLLFSGLLSSNVAQAAGIGAKVIKLSVSDFTMTLYKLDDGRYFLPTTPIDGNPMVEVTAEFDLGPAFLG